MLRILLLLLFGVSAEFLALAQNSPVDATIVDDLSTYGGTDAFVFNKADSRIYAFNNLGRYERYGIYEKVRTLVVEPADGELPYIYSMPGKARNAYIKTDYIPTAKTRVELVAEVDSKWNHDWNAMFGCGYDKEGWKNLFTFFSLTDYGRGGIQCGDSLRGNVFVKNGSVVWGRKVTYELDATTGTGAVYDADGNVLSYIDGEAKQEDCKTPLYIFAMNRSVVDEIDEKTGKPVEIADFFPPRHTPRTETAGCHNPSMTFYRMKIYEGATLVRDFVPYMEGGVVGVFDKIESKFWPSTESENPLYAGHTTCYEGKIVRFADDDHAYKYTGGKWMDCGPMRHEEIADRTYKDLRTWKTNNYHKKIFEDNIVFDPYENNANIISCFVGTNGPEPLMTKIAVEKGAEYKFSFDYMNADGSNGWGEWGVRAAVCSEWDLSTLNHFAYTGGNILASHILPYEQSLNYIPIVMDFVADSTEETIIFQLGYLNDWLEFAFEFNNLVVSKYVYPVTYPELTD